MNKKRKRREDSAYMMGKTEKRARGIATGSAAEEMRRNIAESAINGEDHIADEMRYMTRSVSPPAYAVGNDQRTEAKFPIGKEEILNAGRILEEYAAEKKMFDQHIVRDEDWWRLRHWEQLNKFDGKTNDEAKRGEIDPKSAWLFNCVTMKHADFMDSIPTLAVLPMEMNDEENARILSGIIPAILDNNDFEQKYYNASLAKCKHGTGAYAVLWDGGLRGGLGDIVVDDIDVLQLFWKGGCRDIQDSDNLFYVTKLSRQQAEEMYPELKENGARAISDGTVEEYNSEDYRDDSGSCKIVDWYYRRNGILHFAKFSGDVLLFATENMPLEYPDGIYRHGMYPFFLDPLFPVTDSPCGFGIIDIELSEQEQIDRTARAMMNNVLGSSRARTYIGEGAGINAADIADPDKEIISFSGVLDDKSFRVTQPDSNADMYMNVISQKVNQMKETSGNTDASMGNAPSGVTAGSAIAALQEVAGKGSRNMIKSSHRVFKRICKCIIELIKEFYTLPRTFRIVGERGQNEYVTFSNQNFQTQSVKKIDGTKVNVDTSYDITVVAQKASAYSSMAQNELALQFYNAGFFDPARADQSMAVLEMMDFKGKEKIIARISQNGTLYQMVTALSERLKAAEAMLGIGNSGSGAVGANPLANVRQATMPEQNGAGVVSEESALNKKARERAAQTTEPR